MTLSLRSRITLFFTSIQSALLVVAFVIVYFGHQRSRLSEIDEELIRTETLVAKAISTDLDEGTPLPAAVQDSLQEIDLPGLSVSILDEKGLPLAGESGISVLSPAERAITEKTVQGNTRRYRARHQHSSSTFQVAIGHPLADLENELASLRGVLVGSLAFSLSLAIALGFWFSGGALRPVTVMAEQARRMTGETAGARLESSDRSDELGALARAFNELLDRIESTLARQRQFMADASHELRTPVSVARTAIEVTEAKAGRTQGEYQECLGVVRKQMTRLSRIVDDLFALARADAGSLPLNVGRFYLDELVAACVKDANLMAMAKGTTVEWTGAEDVEISGDERLLGQMISNLLDNAVRHGEPSGRVTVDLVRQDGRAEISVRDSNQGIAEAEHERIFGRFVRLDPARAGEGAGLGLSIARAIAVAHGGTLCLASAGSLGNAFVVVLPNVGRGESRKST